MSNDSIHKAAREGNVERVRELLDADPSLVNHDDQHEWRPIFHAGLWKHYEVVELLIDRGADLSAHDGYAMHYAGEVPENKGVVELLVRYGGLDAHAEPRSEISRQFIYAVFLANEGRVEVLLTSHPDLVQELYARGDTALHHACRNGDLAVVRILVKGGADVNRMNEGGHFPLYCAAGHGHAETVRYLLQQGADTDQRMKDGKDILEWLEQYLEHDSRFRECHGLIREFLQSSD